MSEQVWTAVLESIPTVDAWNRNLDELKRLAAEGGAECKAFIKAEVERRGYLWSSNSKCYVHPFPMRACSGKNIVGAGWRAGQLAVIFSSKDGPRRYESVASDVPVDVANKLVNSPFPDRLYSLLVKDKIQMQRVM